MSDCEKCWETPCCCGWDYRNWGYNRIKSLIDVLQSELDKRNPSDVEAPTLYEQLQLKNKTINKSIR